MNASRASRIEKGNASSGTAKAIVIMQPASTQAPPLETSPLPNIVIPTTDAKAMTPPAQKPTHFTNVVPRTRRPRLLS